MVCHGSFVAWLTATTVVTILLQIFVPYRSYVKILKWLCLVFLAYVVVALLPAVPHPWGTICRNLFIPHWNRNPQFLLTVVGFLGTTISPYLFFWQAGEEVEEEISEGLADKPGHRLNPATDREIRSSHADTVIGMVASQIITFFI